MPGCMEAGGAAPPPPGVPASQGVGAGPLPHHLCPPALCAAAPNSLPVGVGVAPPASPLWRSTGAACQLTQVGRARGEQVDRQLAPLHSTPLSLSPAKLARAMGGREGPLALQRAGSIHLTETSTQLVGPRTFLRPAMSRSSRGPLHWMLPRLKLVVGQRKALSESLNQE